MLISVTDATTGEALDAFSIVSDIGTCESTQPGYTCFLGVSAGSFSLTVTAAGYQTQEIAVTVEGDDKDGPCSCGYIQELVDVELEPG